MSDSAAFGAPTNIILTNLLLPTQVMDWASTQTAISGELATRVVNNCLMRPTLLVEYTGTALLAHHDYMRKALELPAPSMILKTSFDMGSDQVTVEEDFRDFILQFLYHEYIVRVPDGVPTSVTVIITGGAEGLADGKVERATKAVVEALGSRPEMFVENPEYIAARGAAVLASRLEI